MVEDATTARVEARVEDAAEAKGATAMVEQHRKLVSVPSITRISGYRGF